LSVLRIYFTALWRDSSTPCPWALCDESGSVLQQGLAPLAALPASRDCIGIVAADRVLIFTTQPPPGNKRRWQAALPFIAEEHALTDPDDIHAVPAATADPGTIAVSVITKSWLKQIVAATGAAGVPLRRLVAESLMPVLSADSWTLVWDGCNGFLRTSPVTGLALDCGTQQTPPLALLLSLSNAATPRQIELRFAKGASPAALPSWDLAVPLVSGESWDWQCAALDEATPNLLWGEFTPRLRLFDSLPRLRPALFILLAAFFIEVIGTHIEWAMLAREKSALTHNVERIFHSTFGDDSTLIDAPLQMQRNLAAGRHAAGLADDADFLALLDTTASSLGTPNSNAVQGINYESGKLELDLKLARAADFKSLQEKLQRTGLHVRSSELHDALDGTQAKLTVTLEGLR
jgi:general secretion pathway protein L